MWEVDECTTMDTETAFGLYNLYYAAAWYTLSALCNAITPRMSRKPCSIARQHAPQCTLTLEIAHGPSALVACVAAPRSLAFASAELWASQLPAAIHCPALQTSHAHPEWTLVVAPSAVMLHRSAGTCSPDP